MSNQPFNIHIGIAAPLIRDNIDTDQIIPSREMKSVSKTGLSGGMFAGERYISGREPNPDFVLNKIVYAMRPFFYRVRILAADLLVNMLSGHLKNMAFALLLRRALARYFIIIACETAFCQSY